MADYSVKQFVLWDDPIQTLGWVGWMSHLRNGLGSLSQNTYNNGSKPDTMEITHLCSQMPSGIKT